MESSDAKGLKPPTALAQERDDIRAASAVIIGEHDSFQVLRVFPKGGQPGENRRLTAVEGEVLQVWVSVR